MTTDKRQFLQQLNFLSILANRPPPTPEIANFMWGRLRDVAPAALRRAFGRFGERGQWPTVEQVLDECGCRLADPDAETAQAAADPAPSIETPLWETAYGQVVFRAVGSNQAAAVEQALLQHGWAILEVRTETVPIEERTGRVISRSETAVTQFLAERYRNRPDRRMPDIKGSPAELIHFLNRRLRSPFARRAQPATDGPPDCHDNESETSHGYDAMAEGFAARMDGINDNPKDQAI